MLQSRHSNRNWIGAEQGFRAAPWRHKIGVTDAKIYSDHVAHRGHAGVKLRRARMIAVQSSDPGDATVPGLLNGQFRGAFHDQVAEGVVAVDKRCPGPFVYDSNFWPCIA